MDPYFRPILVSALIVVLLNFLPLPIVGYPMLTYFFGGILAVILFKGEKTKENENFETKVSDVSILGIATGIVVGSILTLIMAINLQNPEVKQAIIDQINEAMKMKSQVGFSFLDDLGPSFYFIFGVVSILFTSIISFFGSLVSLVFVNKAKK
jgi:hypothetical protein